MSRRRNSRADGGFVQVTRQLTRSPACESLSARAGWLLMGLMDVYGGNDNRVAMSRREAMAWIKSGERQVAEAFAELESKGLIRSYQRGGFSRKVRHASVWTLTMFGRGGQKATLDFLDWQPDCKIPEAAKSPEHGCRIDTNTGVPQTPMTRPIGVPQNTRQADSWVSPRHQYGCPPDTTYRSTI
jgi:hypothetical protein